MSEMSTHCQTDSYCIKEPPDVFAIFLSQFKFDLYCDCLHWQNILRRSDLIIHMCCHRICHQMASKLSCVFSALRAHNTTSFIYLWSTRKITFTSFEFHINIKLNIECFETEWSHQNEWSFNVWIGSQWKWSGNCRKFSPCKLINLTQPAKTDFLLV